MKHSKLAFAIVLMGASFGTWAQSSGGPELSAESRAIAAKIQQKLQRQPNAPAIRSVRPLVRPGGTVYEVITESGQRIYTDDQGNVVLVAPRPGV